MNGKETNSVTYLNPREDLLQILESKCRNLIYLQRPETKQNKTCNPQQQYCFNFCIPL